MLLVSISTSVFVVSRTPVIVPSSIVVPHVSCHAVCCTSRQSDARTEGEDVDGDKDRQRYFLVERYKDGTVKRYILGNNSQLQIFREECRPVMNIMQEEHLLGTSWLSSFLRDFILPVGFPGSLSDDYLDYMLLQFPTNVTGWICRTLVTSSLLKAVGVGSSSGTDAAASAAAIRWVSKDGLGAIGRLLIGGRFGNLFDDDPKQWRMYADFIGSAGSIFELSTQIYPAYFLPLASLGNLAKAVARGLKDPSFRVIQNHFAISGNLGEVAAKEEVWEVMAQVLGLALGVLILDTPGLETSYSKLAFTWMGLRLLHLWLRYQSLSVLKFRTINIKRAWVLVKSHVLHHTVPGYVDCNKQENILSWERFLQPRVNFGVSMEAMIGREGFTCTVETLVRLYRKEKYILSVKQHGSRGLQYLVTFKVGATELSVLKSLWQAHWLHEHKDGSDNIVHWLEESLTTLEAEFNSFLEQLNRAGWDKQHIILKVPKDIFFEVTELEHAGCDN